MSGTAIIKTTQLNFSFTAGIKTLDNVNLEVPQGSIYGFLGPNGAGKTTTLRLLLGLLRNQQGKIDLFGKEFAPNRIEIIMRNQKLHYTFLFLIFHFSFPWCFPTRPSFQSRFQWNFHQY